MRIAIIPARAGSTRIPGKNKRLFHGKPIIQYSIEAAQSQRLFDTVWVSTDDPEIRSLALSLECGVHDRPPELCRNEVGTQEVAAAAIAHAQDRIPYAVDLACVIYATAPLMSPADLWRGLEQVQEKGRQYAFSVGTKPLQDAGQFYWGTASAFIRGATLYGPWSAMIPIEQDRVCDINTEEDWTRAERLWAARYMKGCPA